MNSDIIAPNAPLIVPFEISDKKSITLDFFSVLDIFEFFISCKSCRRVLSLTLIVLKN